MQTPRRYLRTRRLAQGILAATSMAWGLLFCTPAFAFTVDYSRSPSDPEPTSPITFYATITDETSCGSPEIALDRMRFIVNAYGGVESQNSPWIPYTGTGIQYEWMATMIPTGSLGFDPELEVETPIYSTINVQVQEEASGQGCTQTQESNLVVLAGGGGGDDTPTFDWTPTQVIEDGLIQTGSYLGYLIAGVIGAIIGILGTGFAIKKVRDRIFDKQMSDMGKGL